MSLLDDNAAFDATTLIAALDVPRLTVNDLPVTAFRRKALLREHLPSLLTSTLFPSGYSAGKDRNVTWEDYYIDIGGATDTWADTTIGGANAVDLQLMGTSGASPPYGPNTAVDTGWRILAKNGVVADAAEVVYSTAADDLASNGVDGVIAILTVEIGAPNIVGGVTTDDAVWTAIGFKDGTDTFFVIERSIMAHTSRACPVGGIKTGTFITQADLDLYGDGDMKTIVGLFSTGETRGLGDNPNNGHTARVGSYFLSCLPVRGEAL